MPISIPELVVHVSVTANEVIPPGSTVEIEVSGTVDPQSAHAAIRVMRGCTAVPVTIEVAKKGRVILVHLDGETIGSCMLTIRELLSAKGERLVDQFVLPFAVIPISGKLPPELRVEHTARLFFGELSVERLAPGQLTRGGHVDAIKAVNRKDGTPVELAFDNLGERVDLAAKYAELNKRRDTKFGRLHETLFDKIANAKDDEKFPVIVWPRIQLPPAPYEKASDRRSVEPPDGERKVTEHLRKASAELLNTLQNTKVQMAKDDRQTKPDDGVPIVRAVATAAQLRELARNSAIGVIMFDDPTAINDLGDSIAVARSNNAHLAGFDGTGVRVAVWEDGPSVTTNLSFAGRFSASPVASNHARLTSAVVKNIEPNLPHGHAPDCDLFSANSGDVAALRWAVRDQHCTVISQSFHRGTEPGGAGLQADDLLKDWLALRWPFPTIVQAAGNFWATDPDGISPPESEFVNHKGFNSLAIGNHDDTAGAMAGDSVFRNPSSSHGDRELPELAANGTGVSANGQTMSGTSFAAPATAGVTALLQDVDSVLCSWPEGCRAILLASAGRNVRDGTWWNDVASRVDARDGAGAVDAQAGVWIAQQRRFRDAPATRRGWDVGTLSSGAFGADRLATFRYRVTVPNLMFFATVKVALAWDSAVTSSGDTATASTLTVDFDLIVRDSKGVQVASAASWDNSYEVTEFAARAGETYEIIIRRWSGTDSVWYGIAWNVTGISLFSSVLFPETLEG
jgi:Subtilase family